MRIIVLALLLAAGAAQAQTYKCVGAGGAVEYSDAPCGGGKRGQAIEVKPAAPRDEANARALERQTQRDMDYLRRREAAEQAATERRIEAAADRRAAADRDKAWRCDQARDQVAWYESRLRNGVHRDFIEHNKQMLAHHKAEAEKACK